MKTLLVDGTGAKKGQNSTVVTRFAKHLEKKHDIPYEFIEYPAKYIMGGMSYGKSVEIGKQNLLRRIRQEPDETFILVGFSQGATVVGDVLRENDFPNCIGALIADPHRPKNAEAATYSLNGDIIWAPVPWSGVGGGKPIENSKAFYAANHKDMITAAADDSLWRTFADITEYLGPDLNATFTDLSIKLNKHVFQNWGFFNFFTMGARISRAEMELHGYTRAGEHNDAYVRGEYSLVERLADAISWYIRQKNLLEVDS